MTARNEGQTTDLTWGQFKSQMEAWGAKDEDFIGLIRIYPDSPDQERSPEYSFNIEIVGDFEDPPRILFITGSESERG